MRICPTCSKENPDYIKRCLDCGKNVAPSSGKSYFKVYIAITIVLAGVAAFVVVKKPFSALPTFDAPADVTKTETIAVPLPPPSSEPVATGNSSVQAPSKEEIHPQAALITPTTDPKRGRPEDMVVEAMPAPPESAKAIPKPRKRLQHQALDTADILTGNSPSTFKMKGPDGKPGRIQSASEGYMRMLHHVIVKEFMESLAKQGLSAELGERFRVTLMINSRSSEIEILKIWGNSDLVKQELLRRVISNCSGRVLCPRELYDDIGEYVKLEFPLSATLQD